MNHKSEKLDALIGKKVTVTFFDGDSRTGVLSYTDPTNRRPGFYYVDNLHFRKSHVKSIKEER